MTHFLGIDIGTSSAKVTLLDTDPGEIIMTASAPYPVHHPQPGYAEQNPDDWWRAVVVCVRQIAEVATLEHIAGIGLTGQMHGTVFIGQDNQPSHPAVIWADQRSAAVLGQMRERIHIDDYVNIAGTIPVAGFMASTLVWLTHHQPEVLSNAAHILLPKDYVRLKLTGTIGTDISDASATGLFDIQRQSWSQKIVDAFNLPGEKLAAVSPSAEVIGKLTARAATELGLGAGVPVVAGCADQPAQAIANGINGLHIASMTIGSGGQVFVPTALSQRPQADPRLHLFNHAVPDIAYALGAILSAGLSLRWLRDLFNLPEKTGYATLSAAAETAPIGAEGLIFLPYLYGERTPHMDANARGAFIGLTHRHTQSHMARAVIEGVCFAMRQTLEAALAQRNTSQIPLIIGSGGALAQPIWQRIMVNILGRPIQLSQIQEQTSTGAALLAAIGTGAFASYEQASAAVARPGNLLEPDPQHHALYEQRYQQFCSLYPTLHDDFHRLGESHQ